MSLDQSTAERVLAYAVREIIATASVYRRVHIPTPAPPYDLEALTIALIDASRRSVEGQSACRCDCCRMARGGEIQRP